MQITMQITDRITVAIDQAREEGMLLVSNRKKGLYAPGSVTQILARHPELLDEYEGKVHKYVRDELLDKWYKRFELIRTKGYGLCHIKVPCLDPELDEIDGINDYMGTGG